MARENSLEALRKNVDRIDEAMQDLVIERSLVVESIREIKGIQGASPLRPGREAEILRRLVARHRGRFPKIALVRMWRQILGAMVGLQGEFSCAVFAPERGAGYLELARDHYGVSTPMVGHHSPGHVVRAVAEGSATVGIVPMPMPDTEDVEPWWVSLMGDSPDLPRIVSRLPFAPCSVGEGVEALVIGRIPVEPTGYDRSWLAVETNPDVSRGRLRTVLGAAGLETTNLAATIRGEGHWLHLAEIAEALTGDDRRLARLVADKDPVLRAVVLGNYPAPFSAEDLSD